MALVISKLVCSILGVFGMSAAICFMIAMAMGAARPQEQL